jgi:uncharacterized membrane protein YphA (DoxX/SURF4 family)
MGIYVEILVRAPMDALWGHTQAPALHERWDLRFSEIRYLPRATPDVPQRFRYATRIGFGLVIAGEGETTADRRELPDGGRASALRFWSAHPLSLIREGSGYWKYVPTTDGVRFLTWYDYRTRFGALGALADRVAFRPLMTWATAWSFDRLRLWLEAGADPARAARQALAHAVARTAVAFVFAWQGLVPKLLGPHADEVAMLRDAGVPAAWTGRAVAAAGVAELALALWLVLGWRRRGPALATLGAMAAATVGVAVHSPRYLGAAFNPVSLNLAVACLAAVDLLLLPGLPSAARCRRGARVPAP